MAQTVLVAPLNAVRRAVYARIEADPVTAAYTLASEGGQAAFPYIAVGPAYKGRGGVDPATGVRVNVQVEAYALATNGGAFRAEEMLQDVAVALSSADMTVTVRTLEGPEVTSEPLQVTIGDDVLTPDLRDSADGEVYAQRFARFEFLITTP